MKVGNGIVKKYSREYNRTLKNGEKKKYTTEQIQITVPKNEDIYENKEEVLIIPNSEIDEFKSREEENEALKIANFLYAEEVNELTIQLEENAKAPNPEYENEISQLKAEIDEKDTASQEMKNKYENLHSQTIESLKTENDNIKDKHAKLITENENLKTKFVNIKTENENLKTKYSSIKEENSNLKNKCSSLKEENSSLKESFNHVSMKHDHLKQENLSTKTAYAEIYEINEGLEKDYDSLRLEYNDLVDRYNALEEELYKTKKDKRHDELIANRVKQFMLKRN